MNKQSINILIVVILLAGMSWHLMTNVFETPPEEPKVDTISLPEQITREITCPDSDTQNLQWRDSTIALKTDPAFNEIGNILTLKNIKKVNTISELIVEDPELILIINKAEDQEALINTNSKNKEKSRKIACLILNNINQSNSIRSINPLLYAQNSPEFFLRTDKPAILLNLPPDDMVKTALSIHKALRSYYE